MEKIHQYLNKFADKLTPTGKQKMKKIGKKYQMLLLSTIDSDSLNCERWWTISNLLVQEMFEKVLA